MRPTITLTFLLSAGLVSAETYREQRVFEASLDFPPLRLSEVIAVGLPIDGINENLGYQFAERRIELKPVLPPVRLPPIRTTSQSYPTSSLLPNGSIPAPNRQSLITRDVDLSGFSLD